MILSFSSTWVDRIITLNISFLEVPLYQHLLRTFGNLKTQVSIKPFDSKDEPFLILELHITHNMIHIIWSICEIEYLDTPIFMCFSEIAIRQVWYQNNGIFSYFDEFWQFHPCQSGIKISNNLYPRCFPDVHNMESILLCFHRIHLENYYLYQTLQRSTKVENPHSVFSNPSALFYGSWAL